MNAAFGVVGLLGVIVFFLRAVQFPSMPDGLVTAAIAILPPLVFWLWWHDPSPTMSESIHEARNEPVRRRPMTRD